MALLDEIKNQRLDEREADLLGRVFSPTVRPVDCERDVLEVVRLRLMQLLLASPISLKARQELATQNRCSDLNKNKNAEDIFNFFSSDSSSQKKTYP